MQWLCNVDDAALCSHAAESCIHSTICSSGPGKLILLQSSCCVQAHSAPVTSVHASEYGMQLWSGAQDGSMCAWDMRFKPSQPAVKVHQVVLHLHSKKSPMHLQSQS